MAGTISPCVPDIYGQLNWPLNWKKLTREILSVKRLKGGKVEFQTSRKGLPNSWALCSNWASVTLSALWWRVWNLWIIGQIAQSLGDFFPLRNEQCHRWFWHFLLSKMESYFVRVSQGGITIGATIPLLSLVLQKCVGVRLHEIYLKFLSSSGKHFWLHRFCQLCPPHQHRLKTPG